MTALRNGDGQHVYGTPSFRLCEPTSKTMMASPASDTERQRTAKQDRALGKLIRVLGEAVFADAGVPMPSKGIR